MHHIGSAYLLWLLIQLKEVFHLFFLEPNIVYLTPLKMLEKLGFASYTKPTVKAMQGFTSFMRDNV